jgi:hypothetical protein
MPVDIDHARADLAVRRKAICRKCSPATTSRLGDNIKSMISPVLLQIGLNSGRPHTLQGIVAKI